MDAGEVPVRRGANATAGQAIDVAAALVFRDGRLLITQRHADAHLGGLWEFPGGKREPNETFEECLARELAGGTWASRWRWANWLKV